MPLFRSAPALSVCVHTFYCVQVLMFLFFLLAGNGWPQGSDGLETADLEGCFQLTISWKVLQGGHGLETAGFYRVECQTV